LKDCLIPHLSLSSSLGALAPTEIAAEPLKSMLRCFAGYIAGTQAYTFGLMHKVGHA
jgi:hypothetical protein